ncbi:MAG: arginine deiminase-related protein [Cyclobacteriaceae bacterium]|jgi:hypothetical protein|nr:arginine deiminase-related protein [Cyclobacteriaceae bacterium]
MNIHQAARHILMVRPASFYVNRETSLTNRFQHQPDNATIWEDVHAAALAEFDTMVDLIRQQRINVMVVDDTPEPRKPDAVFPNNWVSFHPDGRIILYPMMATNRRTEARDDIVEKIKADFTISEVIDLRNEAIHGCYLEGTGSLVFDYPHQLIYASRSPRTDEGLAKKVADILGYRLILFDAVDDQSTPVYHTNVVMSIGSRFAIICLDAIPSDTDQEVLLETLATTGKKVVAISYEQMKSFAGNCLEVINAEGEPVVIMSQTAFQSLLPGQVDAISRFADVLPVDVSTIEKYGGGSVRCMMAGIYLPIRAR